MTTQINAVVLPAGIASSGRLQAVLYLSPRLSGAHLLSSFPDWLDWTALVHDHGLQVDLASESRTATVAVDTTGLRPDLWQAVVSSNSIVDAYPADDFDRRLVVSYPSRVAHDFVRFAYQRASTAVGREAPQRTLEVILEDLVFRDESGKSTLDNTLSRLRVDMWNAQQGPSIAVPPQPQPAVPLTKPPETRAMVERLALYHRLPAAPNRPPLPTTPDQLAQLVDFHEALSALTAYPSLLHAVGLALELELPDTLCPDSPAGGAYLDVAVTGIDPGWTWSDPPTLVMPATAYERRHGVFTAAPATSPSQLAGGSFEPTDVVDGFLALAPADFLLVGVDLDGAMLKAMALADSLVNASDESLADGLLPSLRSSGISLLADGRAQQLLRAIRDNNAFAGASSRPLNARDLTRGYRIDIFSDRSNAWHSLHRRDGTYRLGSAGDVIVQTSDEEGFTQLAVVQPADDSTRKDDPVATAAGAPQPGTDLYVNERVARWNGWSLSAPRPGTPLNRSPDPSVAAEPDPTVGEPVTTFKLSTAFAVHRGTLPLLRFGHRYRLRARAVDLAGNSVPPSADAPEHAVAPADGSLPYFRFEPVGHPIVVLREVPAPGSSLLHLAIRTRNTDPTLDAAPVAETDERHIAPPAVAEQLAEHHGLLDDGGHLRGDTAMYEFIVERDQGEIPSVGNDPIEPGSQLSVNYFPDPLARGAAFTDLPQTEPNTDGSVSGGVLSYARTPGADPHPTSVTHLSFGDGWPGREAFRILLREGTAAPTWDDANRELAVSLPKGRTTTTNLSSFTAPEDLDLLGVWNWMREIFEAVDAAALEQAGAGEALLRIAADRTRLTQLVLDGGNEFITPSLPLTFTHAVQQPLGRPAFIRLPIVHRPSDPIVAASLANSFSPVTAWRSQGSHHAVLLGALHVNGKSTAAVDLNAGWTDWIDDVDEPAPTLRPGSGHVDRIELSSLDQGTLAADGTNTRQVAVYVPEIDALWFAAPFDELDGVPSPGQVAAPVHQLNDTKHRVVRYRATASSRFQEYFPEPGAVCTRVGPALAVDVPSSARPLPPDIAYVVPTFGWDSEVTTNTKTEVRFGNSLRVYIRRPWYSSGSGELLGVVLWPGSDAAPSDDQREANKTLLTQWGLDPVWASGSLSAVPTLDAFPNAARTATALELQESSQLVDVAGHRVAFDRGRGLWYCDIQLDNPSSYTPFVRLALARYQPRSIPGVELSHVTLADFAQLASDRSAALTVDPADPRRARLVVAGRAPDGPTQSYFSADVEARRPDVDSDLGWEPAAPGAVQVIEDVPAPSQPQSVLLSAQIVFAQAPAPGAFRLVVREYEILEVDPPDTVLSDRPELGGRLVYAAVLPFDYPLKGGAT